MDGGLEVADSEIGPALGEEDEFGEGAFPEQEVGEALFAAGADQQVDVGRTAARTSARTLLNDSCESSVTL